MRKRSNLWLDGGPGALLHNKLHQLFPYFTDKKEACDGTGKECSALCA